MGAEAGAASGIRKTSGWLRRGGGGGEASALALALPQPPAGVRGSGALRTGA